MNKQQKIIVSIVGITIVLLALLGITYAYYLTRIQGNTNTNSISITTADLKLVYGDGNGLLTAQNIIPGKQVEFKTTNNTTNTEKTFTVTNSGNSLVEGYAVSLDYAYIADTMPSIFERPEDFQITLTCTTSITGETCNGFTGNFNNESIMMTSNDIEVGEIHTYSLSIYYNDPGVDQSNDMGKNLNLKVQIYNLSESTDIEGTITGVDSTYAVRIESEPKMSTIVNGKYNFKGIEIGTHTLTVLDKDGNEIDKEYIVVKSGTAPSIAATKATVNNTEVDATGITITLEERVAKLSTKVESNVLSFDTSTSSTVIFNPYSSNKNGLAYQIINNAIIAQENNSTTEAIYSSTPLTEPGKEVSGDNEMTLSMTSDDYGISYYYRGNVQNNYVNFADMCWRIVRIEGNGNVKLILEDQYDTCEQDTDIDNDGKTYTGNWDLGNVHYGYKEIQIGEFLHHAHDFESTQSSSMKAEFNIFLENIDSSLINKYMVETTACIGDTIKLYDSSGNVITEISLPNYYYYETYFRIKNQQLTLKCEGKNSKSLPTYIVPLNIDEVGYAGASLSSNVKNNSYLFNEYFNNSNTGFLLSNITGFAAEVRDYANVISNGGELMGEGHYFTSPWVSEDYTAIGSISARPAILLKNNIQILEGTGTQSNPYVIE